MILFDVPEDILEGFWRLQATTVDAVVDARRAGKTFNCAEFVALWTGLRGRIVSLVDRKNHIVDHETTGGALVIIGRHTYTQSPHISRRKA